MLKIKILYLMLFMISLLLCGCKNVGFIFSSEKTDRPLSINSDRRNILTKEQVLGLDEQFDTILYKIVHPTFEYIGSNTGPTIVKEYDYIAIAEYFRDNDFSEELSQLENLYEQIREIIVGETNEQGAIRVSMRTNLQILKPIVEVGQNHKDKEIIELSKEEELALMFIDFLDVSKDKVD